MPVTFIEETVWNTFVVFTVPELDPDIVSVKAAPFKSVPAITKELAVVSLLEVTAIWAPRYEEVEIGPSRVKDPEEVTDNSCTKLSSSLIPTLDIVPIWILPLAVADDVIDVIELNLVDPIAVLDDATPVMF